VSQRGTGDTPQTAKASPPDRNRLCKFDIPKQLSRLRCLRLSDNQIVSLDLRHCPNLRILHADQNRITVFGSGERLSKLETLSLRYQSGKRLSVCVSYCVASNTKDLLLTGSYQGNFGAGHSGCTTTLSIRYEKKHRDDQRIVEYMTDGNMLLCCFRKCPGSWVPERSML